MRAFRFALFCLTLTLMWACKQQSPPSTPSAAPADFGYLQQYDLRPYLEGLGTSRDFSSRLKKLTGSSYKLIVKGMKKANPEGILSDGLWYTLFAEYEEGGIRYQTTIVADLPQNNLAAGHWNDQTDEVTHFIENPAKVPPPFQAWLDDSN